MRLPGHRAGAVEVRSATGHLSADEDGEPLLRFSLTVSDPPENQETWPLEDVQAIRLHVQSLASEADAELPYAIVSLQPETPDPPEDESAPDDDLGRALDNQDLS